MTDSSAQRNAAPAGMQSEPLRPLNTAAVLARAALHAGVGCLCMFSVEVQLLDLHLKLVAHAEATGSGQ
jgi:hypothetical protein